MEGAAAYQYIQLVRFIVLLTWIFRTGGQRHVVRAIKSYTLFNYMVVVSLVLFIYMFAVAHILDLRVRQTVSTSHYYLSLRKALFLRVWKLPI